MRADTMLDKEIFFYVLKNRSHVRVPLPWRVVRVENEMFITCHEVRVAKLHLVTMDTTYLSFEPWLDPDEKNLIVRVIRKMADDLLSQQYEKNMVAREAMRAMIDTGE